MCSVDKVECMLIEIDSGIIVAVIFLVEKTIIQLISINYHHKQYDQKIRESKKLVGLLDLMYDRSRALFPEVRNHDFATFALLTAGSSARILRKMMSRSRAVS